MASEAGALAENGFNAQATWLARNNTAHQSFRSRLQSASIASRANRNSPTPARRSGNLFSFVQLPEKAINLR